MPNPDGVLGNETLVRLVLDSLTAAPFFDHDGAARYVSPCPSEARGMARLAALIEPFAGCRVEEIEDVEHARDVLRMLREIGAVAAHEALLAGGVHEGGGASKP